MTAVDMWGDREDVEIQIGKILYAVGKLPPARTVRDSAGKLDLGALATMTAMHVGILLGVRKRQLSEDVVVGRRELVGAGTGFYACIKRVPKGRNSS